MIEAIEPEDGAERRDRGQPPVDHWRSLAALLAILGLAAGLRLYRLSTIPAAFDVDEASVGYDVYCLLHNARDQYGAFLPLFARAADVWEEAFHRYLMLPSVWFFGLNEFGTRLPSALIGVANVGALYLMTRQLANRRTALAAAFFLAVSPWHIQESRIVFREILLPLTVTLGLYYFLRGTTDRRGRGLVAAGVVFALSLWTYSAARVFVPLFVAGLAVIYRRELKAARRTALAGALIFIAVFCGLMLFWASPEGMARANQVLLYEPARIIYNYATYFDPRYLFRDGINHPLHSPPYFVGNLQLVEILTLSAGLAATFWLKPQTAQLLWLWLVLYPVPAFLTDGRQSVRSIAAAPLFALLSGLGASAIVSMFYGRARKLATASLALAVAVSVGVYLKLFFVDYARLSTEWWDYGVGQAIRRAEASDSPVIYISDKFFMPHIFVLFYTAYSPEAYQAAPIFSESKYGWGKSYAGERVGRYEIARVLEQRRINGEALFMIRDEELDEFEQLGYDARRLETIRDLAGVERIHLIMAKAGTAP